MGGGPSQSQRDAASAQQKLSASEAAAADRAQKFKEDQQALVNPFFTERLKNGLPYISTALDYAGGTNARAFAPAKAALLTRLGTSTGLPSGYRDQALTDFESSRARSFDDSITGLLAANEQAKQNAAGGLLGQAQLADPMSYYNGSSGANKSILDAQSLTRPGWASVIGSFIGAGANAGSAYLNRKSQYGNPNNAAFSTNLFPNSSYT